MKRRSLLAGAAALAAFWSALLAVGPQRSRAALPRRRVRPGEPGWPSEAEWQGLREAVGGRLVPVTSPLAACRRDPGGAPCAEALKDLGNPFWIQDQPGGTQSAGWIDGWTAAPSVYAVVAETPADVVAAVDFARERNLRLVVKGGAHSYLGQSNAPDSLLLWTKGLDAIELHDAFVPRGCAGQVEPRQAVSVGSGATFVQLYDAVTTKAGRYVQGGGCTSVGVGGHAQTGGFGSFSKYGGLTAGGLLEAEIVTADGKLRVVNACNDPELFEALKGGGAGFGITTRLTLATLPLPGRFGFYGRTVKARSDTAFRRLVGAFCRFAPALVNPHWGEQVALTPDNALSIEMVFQDLSEAEALAVWQPFQQWLDDNPDAVAEAPAPRLVSMPARHWWDYDYRRAELPDSIIVDERPEAAPGRFWWSGNDGEVGIYLSGYQSLWLPEALLAPERREALAEALFAASRRHKVGLHFNKGLAGATEARRVEARRTAVHPGALDAFALAIIAGGQPQRYPGVPGREPDRAAARAEAGAIDAAYAELRRLAPDSGSYSSEMSYFEEDWQQAAWGPHYPRLLAAKRKYDPAGLFTGHHQVGSESWSADGFTRLD